MTAELAARRTAAAAALADFRREVRAFTEDLSNRAPEPDAIAWAQRLAAELRSLLEQLAAETPDPAAGQLAAIRAVFDVFDWETDDRQYALEQIEEILRGAS